MNRTTFILALTAGLGAGVAHAQPSSDTAVVQPSSPAPAIVSSATPNSAAPTVVQAPAATAAPTSVTQIVYMPQLPNPADLTNAAAAQGLTVERIVQTSNQVIAFYRNASGQATSVAYQSLPPVGVAATPAPAPNVVVTSPPPTVVYETAPRVVYYDYPAYYYPRVWYPPVSFNFGFGYHRGYYGGHFRHR